MEKIKYRENPRFKDRLFIKLFGSEEYKEYTVSLCNALTDSNYTADDIVEFTTLEDVVYIRMKNDSSFLIDSYMNLLEHQSTINPNMPLRGFIYFGNLYAAYVDKRDINIYGSTLVKIPAPRYIVFYNGTKDVDPVIKYKLSDAFIHEDKSGEFEWTATMININKGKNDSLLDKCRPLKEYMIFIEYIREYQGDNKLTVEAVDKAVDRCIKEGILVDFLKKHRSEVRTMLLTEFNEEVFVKGIKEEGREEGREEGKTQAINQAIQKLMKNLKCTREEAMQILEISEE